MKLIIGFLMAWCMGSAIAHADSSFLDDVEVTKHCWEGTVFIMVRTPEGVAIAQATSPKRRTYPISCVVSSGERRADD